MHHTMKEPQLGGLLRPERTRAAERRPAAAGFALALSGLRVGGGQADPGQPGNADVCFLSTRDADGSVTPGQHASFLGKVHDPLFIPQDPTALPLRCRS